MSLQSFVQPTQVAAAATATPKADVVPAANASVPEGAVDAELAGGYKRGDAVVSKIIVGTDAMPSVKKGEKGAVMGPGVPSPQYGGPSAVETRLLVKFPRCVANMRLDQFYREGESQGASSEEAPAASPKGSEPKGAEPAAAAAVPSPKKKPEAIKTGEASKENVRESKTDLSPKTVARKQEQAKKVKAWLKENDFTGPSARKDVAGALGRKKFTFPLHAAVEQGDADMVRLLLKAGASKTEKDSKLRTPLQLARTHDNGSCCGFGKRSTKATAEQSQRMIDLLG